MKKIIILSITALIISALIINPAIESYAEKQVPANQAEITLSYAPLVKKAAPAVVNIYTRRKVKVQNISPFFNDPFFQQFFGDQFGGVYRERIVSSLGSGVIVKPEGLVVTNNHVIKDSSEITVVLADKREFEADLVLNDPKTDLALLQIKTSTGNLPYAEMDDSDNLEVGDIVLAIGNPFGIGQTVTSGIVSALARTTLGVSDLQFFIQTDAAINPGNSGGALINMQGRLIGVPTAIYSRTGSSNGIGFAIPSNMVKTVVSGKHEGGRVIRPWLGIQMEKITPEAAAALGLDKANGVIIKRVHSKSPLKKAGLREGDVITGIDNFAVEDEKALRFRVATYLIGTEAKIKYFRDGEEKSAALIMEAPAESAPRDTSVIAGRNPLAGVTIANMSPEVAEEIGASLEEIGVVIVGITEGTLAERFGVRPGDVIVAINRRQLKNVDDLKKELKKPAQQGWAIVIKRGEKVINLTVRG